MFGQGSKSTKPLQTINSRKQFVNQVKNVEFGKQKLSNYLKFDTVEKLVVGRKPEQTLRQTKLHLQPTNIGATNSKIQDRVQPKAELIFLPLPKKRTPTHEQNKLTAAKTSVVEVKTEEKLEPINKPTANKHISPLLNNGRDMICLLGRVDFCLKMHKLYPEVNAMWDIYGKLLKITCGKYRGEHNLLMRNNNSGPLMQCIYYDFDGVLKKFHVGTCFIRAVGRFVATNRLQAYKVEEISSSVCYHQHFQRIQNVTSFVLTQNHTNNSKG